MRRLAVIGCYTILEATHHAGFDGAGQIVFTRMPERTSSTAAVFVMPMTACLLAP